MLQVIREKVTGWFAGVIIGLLTIPFALWGINNYFTAQVDNAVAKVNDHEIPTREFQNRYRQYQQRLKNQFKGAIGPDYFEQATIKRQFLQNLIEEVLLMEWVTKNHLKVSPQELADFIASYQAFQVDGQFNPEVYKSLLRQQGLSARRFEQQVESSILLARIPQFVQQSSFFVEKELAQFVRLLKQKRDFDYGVLTANLQDESLQVSDEEIQQWYEAHKNAFKQPEEVRIQYIELKAEDLAAGKPVDEETIRQRYEQQKQRFVVPERRKVSHILLELPKDADEAARKAAEAKMAEIRAQLDQGADFAELAKQYSQDPGSSTQGGDLGWVEPGVMVPEFEKAMNALTEVGQISPPVRTDFGLHILRLDAYEPEHGKRFEEARAELEKEYREEQAEKAYLEVADKLVEQAFEDPNSLEPAAEATGLKVETSDYFPQSGGQGIAANPEVVKAAFSDPVKNEGQNSEAIELGDNHMVVLRVADVKPESIQPLDAVREQVVQQIKREKAEEKLAETRKQVEQALQDGQSLADALKLAGATVKSLQDISRTDHPKADPGVVAHVFKQSAVDTRPHCDELGGTRVLCYQIHKVVDGSLAEVDKSEREQIEQQLSRSIVNAELEALLAELEAQAEITIMEDQL